MRTYRDTGIIFKQVNINEADKIVSILTRRHGRVDAVAKGVRRVSSRMGPSIDLFTKSRFSFAKGKNLDVITESQIVDNFEQLKDDLDNNYKLFFIAEVLDKLLEVENAQREIYELIDTFLSLAKDVHSLSHFAVALQLLALLGFEPNVTNCLMCGKQLEENEKRFMSNAELGLLCENESTLHGREVSNKLLKVIRFLLAGELVDIAKLQITDELHQELRPIVITWVESVLEKEIKSKRYI